MDSDCFMAADCDLCWSCISIAAFGKQTYGVTGAPGV
jgi:hypothetical protein